MTGERKPPIPSGKFVYERNDLNMKKISLSLILAMMMVLSLLAGCGGNNGGACRVQQPQHPRG